MADYQQKSKYTRAEIDAHLDRARGVSNPNLLDNWYFGNPVDQRGGYMVPPGVIFYGSTDTALSTPLGTTAAYDIVVERNSTYAKFVNASGAYYLVAASDCIRGYTGMGYGIDRWNLITGTLLIRSNGICLYNAFLDEYFDEDLTKHLVGKTITISALTSDGLCSATAVIPENLQTEVNFVSVGFNNGSISAIWSIEGKLTFRIYAAQSGAELYAVKMEIGTQQTLAHQDADGNRVLNEIPDYGEQLARCQRYQLVLRGINTVLGDAAYVRGKYVYVSVPLPVTMRGNTNLVAVTLSGSVTLYSMGGNVVLSELYPSPMAISQNLVQVIFQSSVDLTSGGIVGFTDDNSKLIINRNL